MKVEVFDVNGRAVGAKHFPNASPAPGTWYPAGPHQITFDGSGMPSGVYLYRVQAGNYSATGKMVLLK